MRVVTADGVAASAVRQGDSYAISISISLEATDQTPTDMWISAFIGDEIVYFDGFDVSLLQPGLTIVQQCTQVASQDFKSLRFNSDGELYLKQLDIVYSLPGSGPFDMENITYTKDTPIVTFVRDWHKIENFSLVRCLSDGTTHDEGTNAKLSVKLSASSYGLANLANLRLMLYYSTGEVTDESDSIDMTSHISDALSTSGITDDTSSITQTFTNGETYNFMLRFGTLHPTDRVFYEYVDTGIRSLVRAFANVHMSGAMTGGKQVGGVALGKFSSVENGDLKGKFECAYPAYFEDDVFDKNGNPMGGGSYSETESVAGTWIDDKTIYRVAGVWTGSQKGRVWLGLTTLPAGYDNIINMNATYQANSTAWFTANHPDNTGTSNTNNVYLDITSTGVLQISMGTSVTLTKVVWYVDYTKSE